MIPRQLSLSLRRSRMIAVRSLSDVNQVIISEYAKETAVQSDTCDVVDGGIVGPYRLRRPLKLPPHHQT